MKAKKIPSNLEMYKMLRSNLYTTDIEYDTKRFTLPLEVQDFVSIEGVHVSYMIHLAQGCSDFIHGIFYVNVVSNRGKPHEAIVVLCKRKDAQYELRAAIKTRQAVGGVLECTVTSDGTTVSWPSDPFGLHTLILSQYNEETINKSFASSGGIDTPLSDYVELMARRKRYGVETYDVGDVSGLLCGVGTAYQWYDFLKWCDDQRRREHRSSHVIDVRCRSHR